MKKTVLILMLLIPVLSFSQSRKKIMKFEIQSKTTYAIDYEDSNGREEVEEIEVFDAGGNVIELKEYEKGKLTKHRKYEYNYENDLTKEIRLRANGKVYKTIVYKYNDIGIKIEKIVYDHKDIMVSRKKYVYKTKGK